MSEQRLPVVDEQLTYNLIQEVRNQTDISYNKSKLAVSILLSKLESLLPDENSQKIIRQLQSYIPQAETVDSTVLDSTQDCVELQNLLKQLVEVKEDSQQRSWQLHEDEHVILNLVEKLQQLLTDADEAICTRVLSSNNYYYIECLIEYYQMETRWSIRSILLQIFGIMCGIDRVIITILLDSILPQELARDIKQSYDQNNIERTLHCLLLLTMIFSMGEYMPLSHVDLLGSSFINFILINLENNSTEDDDIMSDNFLNFLLAYNLQFSSEYTGKVEDRNIVIQCLSQQTRANVFTSKILIMFNREEDPARIFTHEPAPEHSVLKLFVDLFNNEKTASLFYTSDIMVLIDILVRQLSDISAGEPKRLIYLKICKAVLNHCNYEEHRHRSEDLLKCFTRIQEEIPPCDKEIELVNLIIEKHFQ